MIIEPRDSARLRAPNHVLPSSNENPRGSFPLDRDAVTTWMKSHHWTVKSSGSGGELWASNTLEGAEIGVPFGPLDEFLSDSVIKRLAYWHQLELKDLINALNSFAVDVARFIADVPLDYSTGRPGAELRIVSHLFGGTGKIYRAASRTSRATTQVIGNFSAIDDERYSNALAGLTEPGSYTLPIYVPVGNPDSEGSLGVEAPSESRKLTQTVATALHAIEKHIIQPHSLDISDEVIREMVQKGVSKELLTAVSELITVEGTDAKTRFEWAESHASVPGADTLPTAVEIPHDARDLVDHVATQFRPTPKEPKNFVGLVRGLLLGEGDGDIISIVSVPRGNASDDPNAALGGTIEVTHAEASEEFRDWLYQVMNNGAKVQFSGLVTSVSNRRRIYSPINFHEMPTQTQM